jgi:Aldehyde dehydrogenase family
MTAGTLKDTAGRGASPERTAVPGDREIVDRHWRMLIGGELADAAAAATLDGVNPADETVVTRTPHADASDVDAAVAAARAAAPGWAATSITERAQVLSTPDHEFAPGVRQPRAPPGHGYRQHSPAASP